MSIRWLAFALLAGACVAQAAPPKSKTPKQDAASAQTTPETIDVDALARSKDVDGSTPAEADAPPSDAPPSDAAPSDAPPPADIPVQAPAPVEAAPAEAAATETAPVESAPADTESAEAAAPVGSAASAPTDVPVPTAPSPTTASEAARAAAAAPPATKSSDTSERISVAGSCQARATSLLDSAEKNDFAGATSAFDAKMRSAMPPPKLKEAWEQLAQFGKLQARGQSHLGSGDGYTIVMIPLIFEKANLVAQVACGTDGRIAGFYVKPAPMSPAPAPNS